MGNLRVLESSLAGLPTVADSPRAQSLATRSSHRAGPCGPPSREFHLLGLSLQPTFALRATVGNLRGPLTRLACQPKLAEGERRLAERVGFVPDEPAPLNDLGRLGTAGNRQILSRET